VEEKLTAVAGEFSSVGLGVLDTGCGEGKLEGKHDGAVEGVREGREVVCSEMVGFDVTSGREEGIQVGGEVNAAEGVG
jgi:hypothetical protein